MIEGLVQRLKGFAAVEPLIAIASVLIDCSVLPFVWLVVSRVGVSAQSLSSTADESRLS